jgi:hypothetical protein
VGPLGYGDPPRPPAVTGTTLLEKRKT